VRNWPRAASKDWLGKWETQDLEDGCVTAAAATGHRRRWQTVVAVAVTVACGGIGWAKGNGARGTAGSGAGGGQAWASSNRTMGSRELSRMAVDTGSSVAGMGNGAVTDNVSRAQGSWSFGADSGNGANGAGMAGSGNEAGRGIGMWISSCCRYKVEVRWK
jgi:hypothetical protein